MIIRNNAPLTLAANTCFVAAPAHVRTCDINGCVRLKFTDEFIVSVPVINLLFTVRAFTAGAIKPKTEKLSPQKTTLFLLTKPSNPKKKSPNHLLN